MTEFCCTTNKDVHAGETASLADGALWSLSIQAVTVNITPFTLLHWCVTDTASLIMRAVTRTKLKTAMVIHFKWVSRYKDLKLL